MPGFWLSDFFEALSTLTKMCRKCTYRVSAWNVASTHYGRRRRRGRRADGFLLAVRFADNRALGTKWDIDSEYRGGPTMRGTRFGRKNRPKTGPSKCSAGTNPLFSPRFMAMSVNCAMGNGTHSSVQLDNRGRLWVCNSLPPVARCCCEMPRA